MLTSELPHDGAKDAAPSAGKKKMQRSAPTVLDMSIMGTNDSSIVSKRSVERLYLPEPHLFRHFVKKPKRRAPLINRGYWLRMKTIEHHLSRFLAESEPRKKVIVNLGCGYDPLPFTLLAKWPQKTAGISFVDVDYPSLIENKNAMIKSSPELLALLENVEYPPTEGIRLKSDNYTAVGCDLSDPQRLEDLLGQISNLDSTTLCFVAEVSVTYMKNQAADRLIRWAAKLPDARFILLEQCLPYGPHHPFAYTMLKHFTKLGTRLRSLKHYPTSEDQEQRFMFHGWSEANALSLWQQWSSSQFLTSAERKAIDAIEPFDEWEEFALFAQHYFVLFASTRSHNTGRPAPLLNPRLPGAPQEVADDPQQQTLQRSWDEYTAQITLSSRLHGAAFEIEPGIICHHGGHGPQKRLIASDGLTMSTRFEDGMAQMPPTMIGERVGHTITSTGASQSFVMVGGRTSPNNAIAECWLLRNGKWTPTKPLPFGIYRHSATTLPFDEKAANGTSEAAGIECVLIYGGKTRSDHLSGEWLMWKQKSDGEGRLTSCWTRLSVEGENIKPRFGANMCVLKHDVHQRSVVQGLLMGGMTADGVVCDEVIEWTLNIEGGFIRMVSYAHQNVKQLCRFGAKLVQTGSFDGEIGFYLVGGISLPKLPPDDYWAIVKFDRNTDKRTSSDVEDSINCFGSSDDNQAMIRHGPILVGHSALLASSGREGDEHRSLLTIFGGGATCFSFGIYHNTSLWAFATKKLQEHRFRLIEKGRHPLARSAIRTDPSSGPAKNGPGAVQVRIQGESIDLRQSICHGEPVVFRGLDLGTCTSEWTCDNLVSKVGAEREVVVHFCETDVMNFQQKNFSYQKMRFVDFIDAIRGGGKHYLRALSSISVDKPANFWRDYEQLGSDFKLPFELAEYIDEVLPNGQNRLHSSVLRLSGPVSMWLHYDVMANVLCQVQGRKRLLLYPPSDVNLLGIPPGQSSSSLNVFDPEIHAQHPEIVQSHPHEVHLEAGDVLFIPALWLHTAQPTEGVSMAVNVFFRDLDHGYAAGRDTYGNRDMQAYEEGRKQVAKLVERCQSLPATSRQFYLSRLAQELQRAADEP